MKVQRYPLRRQPRPSRRKLATRDQVKRINRLAEQLGVDRPRVIHAGEAREVEWRLLEHLAHRRQPSLFEGVAER